MRTCAFLLAVYFLVTPGQFRDLSAEARADAAEPTRTEDFAAETKWSGTVTQTTKFFGDMPASEMTSEAKLEVSFTETIPSLYRQQEVDDTSTLTDNKGGGTFVSKGNGKLIGPKGVVSTSHFDCFGIGPAELHSVIINQGAGKYDIEVMGPDSKCKSETRLIPTGDVINSNYDAGSGEPGNSITISQQTLGTNPNVLTGSISESFTNPGIGHGTRAVTWFLSRGPVDAVLLVSPANYNIWLPTAGRDELSKGSVMDIDLKVVGRNGRPTSLKAVRFELKLSATSREPGITLNYPLKPSKKQLPDIRFVPRRVGESLDEDQSVTVESADGTTGVATIGSYDGGGWSTLTAEAVLEGGARIKGHLFTASGAEEILLPKRDPGKKIGSSWLAKHGNPGELDDLEQRTGNPNMGDGLSAYEEYRGFFAIDKGAQGGTEPTFVRLDPRTKELGVRVKKGEFDLFSEGVSLFELASGISVIRFSENEIAEDRRMNGNSSSAHAYDQFVLKLENGTIAGDAVGSNEPDRVLNKLPATSTRVVIDFGKLDRNYQSQTAAANTANVKMPYTKAEDAASTVAHEMAHGVGVDHHGKSSAVPPRKAYDSSNPPYHIFGIDGVEINIRPYPSNPNDFLQGAGTAGSDSSGDLSCIMAYTSLYQWAFSVGGDGSLNYHAVPLLPVGKKFCNSAKGTGINAGSNNAYFGDATYGSCINKFKLKP